MAKVVLKNPLDVIVHQCSVCRYASVHKHNVVRHVGAHACGNKEASVLTDVLQLVQQGQETSMGSNHSVAGDHATVNQTVTNVNVTIENIVYAGSPQDQQALMDLFKNPATIRELSNLPPAEIPAALFRLWKGSDAPPQLKNIRVGGAAVEELRGPGQVVAVPRSKFIKKTVNDMFQAVDAAPTAEVDELRRDLRLPTLPLGGRKRKVSRLAAAEMQATGSRDVYALGHEGRKFLNDSNAAVDNELLHVHDA